MMFGAADSPSASRITDLSTSEAGIMLPLVLLMFWVGLYATPFLSSINVSTEGIIQSLELALQGSAALGLNP